MCGLIGIAEFSRSIEIPKAEIALQSIAHRGPDYQSRWTNGKNIYLGHNRLSIIDLSQTANQPLHSKHSKAVIVFNGEIYNYKKLKNELNYDRYFTNSDTEVILEGYLERGIDFFKKLRGIYSFAILDYRYTINKIILVRDPSGIKPLYYIKEKNSLKFASEIKALKILSKNLEIKSTSLRQFLNLSYIPEPKTVYKNINALEPGCYIEWCSNGESYKKKFFDFSFQSSNNSSFYNNIEKVEAKLLNAIKRNLVADVNLTFALSGGIDSSLVYNYANKFIDNIKAKTIIYSDEKRYNEIENSSIYASKFSGNHQFINLKEKIDLELINKIFLHFDQPFADSSAIPTYLLCREVSNDSKIIIGGDGGDELFNGYPSQTWLLYYYKYLGFKSLWKIIGYGHRIFPAKLARKLDRLKNLAYTSNDIFDLIYQKNSWLPIGTKINDIDVFIDSDNIHHQKQYKSLFSNEIPIKIADKIVFDHFRKNLLSDFLRKTDMMSMLNGVEYRIPMLDEDLCNLALSIPFKEKSNLITGKLHLRSLHKRYYPSRTSTSSKMGFRIPLDIMLSKEDKLIISNDLLDRNSIIYSFINRSYVEFLVDQLKSHDYPRIISREGIYQKILILYNLHTWHENQ